MAYTLIDSSHEIYSRYADFARSRSRFKRFVVKKTKDNIRSKSLINTLIGASSGAVAGYGIATSLGVKPENRYRFAGEAALVAGASGALLGSRAGAGILPTSVMASTGYGVKKLRKRFRKRR